MADEVDAGNDAAELFLREAVGAAASATHLISVSAVCLECDEPTENGARWCDCKCRDEWQARTGVL